MITNKQRALKIKRLLGLNEELHEKNQKNTYPRVADVIADLRHFCDLFKLDWDKEINLSEIHYDYEREEVK